jgi:serine/threonine protein kinase
MCSSDEKSQSLKTRERDNGSGDTPEYGHVPVSPSGSAPIPISESIQSKQSVQSIPSTQCAKIGDYIYFTPCIGKGSFSKVFAGYNINCKTDPPEYVAIKRINLSDLKKISIKRIKREIDLLKCLNHPNIIRFYDSFTDVACNIYIITEYANYGDLGRFIGKSKKNQRLSLDEIKSYFVQFRSGLRYLLANNILHRDIKPQNILLHKSKVNGQDIITVKIADFGFAKHFESLSEDSITETLCGTPMYLSPEVVKSKRYTILSDLWSVGVILYELCYHTTPFKRPRNLLELVRNIDQMGTPSFPPGTDKELVDLLTFLLHIQPEKRMSWGSFFSHPWFGPEDTGGFKESELIQSFIGTAESTSLNSSVAGPFKVSEPISDFMQQILDDVSDQNKNSKDAGGMVEIDDSLLSMPKAMANCNLYNDSIVSNVVNLLSGTKRRSSENNIEVLDSLGQSSRLYASPQIKDNYIERFPNSTSLPLETRVKQLYGQPNIGSISSDSGNYHGSSNVSSGLLSDTNKEQSRSQTVSPCYPYSSTGLPDSGSPLLIDLSATSKPIPVPKKPQKIASMVWPASTSPADVARFLTDSISYLSTSLSPLMKLYKPD